MASMEESQLVVAVSAGQDSAAEWLSFPTVAAAPTQSKLHLKPETTWLCSGAVSMACNAKDAVPWVDSNASCCIAVCMQDQ